MEDLKLFCRKLPKLELHAHLNGSISSNTMQKLLKRYSDHNKGDVPQLWQTTILKEEKRTLSECFTVFKMIHHLVDDEEAVRMVACDVVKEFAEDGVIYLELRSTPRGNQTTGMTKQSYVEAILSGIDNAFEKDELNIKVNLLLSIDRRQSVAEAFDTVRLAISLMGQTHHYAKVVGIDLSGDPTKGDISSLFPALRLAKEGDLKLAVHLAEIPQRNEEASLLLSLYPDRLGHATFIHQKAGGSEKLETEILTRQVPIEICITSNLKCQTVSSYESHHFARWYERCHPLIICTDDKGVFSTSLSEEYAIVGRVFSLNQYQLKTLAAEAINHIFDNDSLKSELSKVYHENKFGK